ncbi:MAG: tetratricopeptide repeat protein [Pseudomonadota bacterium]
MKRHIAYALIAGLCLQVTAAPVIEVQSPEPVFKPLAPVIWQTEPPITGDEVALSQELGAAVRQGNYDQAMSTLESQEQSLSAPFELLRAQLHATAGNYPPAIAAYREALRLAPSFTRAHAGLGTLYLVDGQYENAQRHLAEAVRLGARDGQTFGQLGYLNVRLKNPWGAVAAYQQALMLQPDSDQWRAGLLLAQVESGNYTAASALLDNLLSANPEEPSLWQQRANLALRQEDPVKALTSLEISLRLGADSLANRRAAAQLAVQTGHYRRGAELLSTQIIPEPGADLDFVASLVDWMIQQDQDGPARSVINAVQPRLSSYDPGTRSHFYFLRGRLAEKAGQDRNAAADYRRAVQQDGSNGRALLALAETQLRGGQATRAAVTFRRASAIPAFRRQAMIGEAKAMITAADYEAALRQLNAVAAEFPGAFDLDGTIQSLTSIVNATRQEAP